MPIGQGLFHQLDEPTILPYNGKYQNQPNNPVNAILEVNINGK
jgi:deoxycytidine triphosphate deaminase